MDATHPPGGTPSPVESAPLPLVQRIRDTFFSPTSVFFSLRRNPQVLGALLVALAVAAVNGYLIRDIVADEQIRSIRENPDSTAEVLEQAESQARIVRITTPIFAPVGTLIGALIVTGVLLLLGNVALGGQSNFKTMFAAAAHIFLTTIPESLVKVPLMLSRQTVDVQTSLAAFLSSGEDKGLLYFALAQFDLFGLWRLGLAVLAVTILAGVPLRKAATGVIGAWVLWSAAWVPIQAALSGLGG